MREREIQGKIMTYLKRMQIYAVKVISAGRDGVPDILVCINGRFLAFEVKTQTGQLSELQKYNIGQIIESGGQAFVIRSLDEVINIVQLILRGKK